jgi:hypothetical protein
MVSGCRSVIIPYKGNETCVMNHHEPPCRCVSN